MYEELIATLRESRDKRMLDAADVIEELAKDLERSKDFEAFWQHEAEEALRRFQVAVANKPRWIPVTERLPEKHEFVLVKSKLVKMKTDFISNDGHWYTTPAVTHWMPLPEPPKEET